MRALYLTPWFGDDVARMRQRGRGFAAFRQLVGRLAAGHRVPPEHRDRPLLGGYAGTRECHVEPDWLLVYERTPTELLLIRTGTYADLSGR